MFRMMVMIKKKKPAEMIMKEGSAMFGFFRILFLSR